MKNFQKKKATIHDLIASLVNHFSKPRIYVISINELVSHAVKPISHHLEQK
jgi:hypothetical protein